MERINGLDLFSGIGGLSLALEPWVRTIAYCERDRYAQSVLLSRMHEGRLHRAPIWDDVRTLTRSMLPPIDIIFGGFPCQDISCAGNGAGLAGERSGLFYEIMRLAQEIKPTFIFLENVPAIRTRGLERVARELTDRGYDSRWCALSAQEVGANHKRNRWFLLATYAERIKLWEQSGGSGGQSGRETPFIRGDGETQSMAHSHSTGDRPNAQAVSGIRGETSQRSEQAMSPSDCGADVANTTRTRFQRGVDSLGHEAQLSVTSDSGESLSADWWAVEPDICRVVNGLPSRVDRIKCLGNAVIPLQAQTAFKRLIGL